MRFHLLRNATYVIELGDERILVDPMLSPAGALMPFAGIRHKLRKNPLVPLPEGTDALLSGVTRALVTHCRHGHVDHLDDAGRAFLHERGLTVHCAEADAAHLRGLGLTVSPIALGAPHDFLGGTVRAVPAKHGRGFIARVMGDGVGYVLELPGEPTLYLSGDTVLTDDVAAVLRDQRPAVSVVHAGGASVDVGQPILMTLDEVVEFVRLAPGLVVATHLEALNHCPTTRAALATALENANLATKTRILADGESLSVDA